MNKEEIDICGVLVHAKPGSAEQVKESLLQFPGVEVHSVTEDHRLIVTVDQADCDEEKMITKTISSFHDVKGVLSAALVYQHAE